MFRYSNLFDRDLFLSSVTIFRCNIKAKYGSSFLGSLWFLLGPIVQITMFTFVMKNIISLQSNNVFMMVGFNMITWFFMFNVINESTIIFKKNSHLIVDKGMDAALYIIPDAIEKLYVYCVSFIFVAIISIALYGPSIFHYKIVITIPYICIMFIMSILIYYIIGGISVIVGDISFFINYILPIFLWLTPIMYPISSLDPGIQFLQQFNPFFIVIRPLNSIIQLNTYPTMIANISLLLLFIILLSIASTMRYFVNKRLVYYL